MNPSHKQKKSKEYAPQWYIDACIDAMTMGTGIVKVTLVGGQYDIERIPPSEYLEVADALKWAHEKLKEQASSQSH